MAHYLPFFLTRKGIALMTIHLKTCIPFRYVRVDNAIHILHTLAPGSFMAKTDLKSAFCLIPIHPDDWNLLGIYLQSKFYVDLYLPFGLRSAPFLFNLLSDALEWILKNKYGIKHVIHILDDFYLVEPSKLQCLSSFSTLLRTFMFAEVPPKSWNIWALFWTVSRLPAPWRQTVTRIKDMLNSFQFRRSARLVELQSLMDTLQFACLESFCLFIEWAFLFSVSTLTPSDALELPYSHLVSQVLNFAILRKSRNLILAKYRTRED